MSPDAWDDYAEEQLLFDAEEAYLAHLPTDLHEQSIQAYLGCFGDAIDTRIENLLSTANTLLANKFPGPSTTVAVSAMEVMIRFFCVRPIVEGVFLSDFIEREVTEKITRDRRFPERSLLAGILKPWGIELKDISLGNGKPLWTEFTSVVAKRRNEFVHEGKDVSDVVAATAIECATVFRSVVVMAMAKRLGFTHDKTGCWSRVLTDPKEHVLLGGKITNRETIHTTRSPFA